MVELRTDPSVCCLQNSCLCRTVNNRGQLIYCYSDLATTQGDNTLVAEDSLTDLTDPVTTNLLTAQTLIWSLGLTAL